jgi:collagenase-like PrtC family protease
MKKPELLLLAGSLSKLKIAFLYGHTLCMLALHKCRYEQNQNFL